MGARNPFNIEATDSSQIVDQTVGSAYDITRNLAENLKYIKHLSYYLPLFHETYGGEEEFLTADDFVPLVQTGSSRTDNVVWPNLTAITESIFKFNNVAGMKAVPSADLKRKQIAITLGEVVPSDNLGKIYYWEPFSEATPDDKSIIKPDDIAPGTDGNWVSVVAVSETSITDAVNTVFNALVESLTDDGTWGAEDLVIDDGGWSV